MASDDNMTINSSMHEDDYEEEDDHDQHHPHNLSRLSICSSKQSMFDFDDTCAGSSSGGDMMMMFMSGLSIESSYDEGEADGELSDDHHKTENDYGASSDSDKDIGSSLSLPGTPLQKHGGAHKEYYCSENEAGGKGIIKNKTKRNSRWRAAREKWLESEWERKQHRANSMDGESEGLVLTKPNGGRKSMCMDLGEVKACRDLGFELEHPRMLEIPTQYSFSTMDTASSGANSPISNWRISSPGDDPKDVKARLKVWAQVVAASASHLVG